MPAKIHIDRDRLCEMASHNMRYEDMAAVLGVSVDTIKRNFQSYQIEYSEPSKKVSKFDMDKEELQKYLDMHLTYAQIANIWEEQTGIKVSEHVVGDRGRKFGLHSDGNKYYMRADNPAKRDEVRAKISESVSKLWTEGAYANRVNGMTDVTELDHPNYTIEGSIHQYINKAKFYYPEPVCMCCGKVLDWDAVKNSDNSVQIHHVDHDHANFMLSNLMPLCPACHHMYHRKNQPFATVTKCFTFDAAHYLPYHDRKCKFIHGHTYHMEITIRNIIRLDTGMVMDFSQLKAAVQDNILNKFDHGFLNEYLPYSTCECMVFWIWRELSKDLKGIYKIRLQETDGSFAELTQDDYLQCIGQFESAWHYSKSVDGYDINNIADPLV